MLGRGIVYLQTQKYEYALADFRKLLSINPNHARAYNNIANVYVENKQLDCCELTFRDNLVITGKFHGSINATGDLEISKEAVKYFNETFGRCFTRKD